MFIHLEKKKKPLELGAGVSHQELVWLTPPPPPHAKANITQKENNY
jgi:hypothetical protein